MDDVLDKPVDLPHGNLNELVMVKTKFQNCLSCELDFLAKLGRTTNINISPIIKFKVGHIFCYIFMLCGYNMYTSLLILFTQTAGVTYDNPPHDMFFDNFHTIGVLAVPPAATPIGEFVMANPMLVMVARNVKYIVPLLCMQQWCLSFILSG